MAGDPAAPSPPQNVSRGALKTAILSFIVLAGSAVVVWVCVLWLQPRTYEEPRTYTTTTFTTRKVETEIEVDGKKRKVLIDVPVPVQETRQLTAMVTKPLSTTELVRLWIIIVAAAVVALIAVGVLAATLIVVLKTHAAPPEYLQEWMERIFSFFVGLVIGFMSGNMSLGGSPPTQSEKPVPQSEAPHHYPARRS